MAVNLISCDAGTHKIYVHNGISSTILSSFTTSVGSGSYPNELTFDDNNLISTDWGTDKIYVHNGISSTILSSFATPSGVPNGLTFDGANLISCDPGTDKIYVHDGISSTILLSFATPGGSSRGLAFDGTDLISGDDGARKYYIHDGISSTIKSSASVPGTALPGNPSGLTYDGANLITCSAEDDRIYIIGGANFASPNSYPCGLAIAPESKPSPPTTLKTEGAINPTNVTDKNPELTAIYSHIYGYNGSYYRVQVSKVSNFSTVIWDSGKTRLPTDISKGATCDPISVIETLLLDGTKYYWRIKFWDTSDNEGDWSTE